MRQLFVNLRVFPKTYFGIITSQCHSWTRKQNTMEESDRPTKIRKLSHSRGDNANAPAIAAQEASAGQENVAAEQQQAESTCIPANGAVVTTSAPSLEADSASKTTTNSPHVAANGNASPPSTTSPNTTEPTSTGDPSTSVTTSQAALNPHYKPPPPPIINPETGLPLSKNQAKKFRRQLDWDAKREDRKSLRKEKNQAKRERYRAQRDAIPPEIRRERALAYVPSTQLPITLLLDCDFDDKMRDNERISLAGQITRSYSENKNAKFRTHLAVSSFGGKLRERFEGVLAGNYVHWKGTYFCTEDFVDVAEKAKEWMKPEEKYGGVLKGVFDKYGQGDEDVKKAQDEGEVIYLSSDSDYTLTELKPYSTYIIGGLVDKNREKGICHRRAVKKGVKTARLPIGEYLDMASRKVLATNHVVEIMLQWLECGDWGEAFMRVIPKRKGGHLKDGKDANDEEFDEEETQADSEAGAQAEPTAAEEDKTDGSAEEDKTDDAAEGAQVQTEASEST